jgi:hypothetical protein
MIMKLIYNSKYLRIKQLTLVISLFSVVLFSSCTEELESPPVVSVFVNNVEPTEAAVTVTGGETVNYRFEINANTTIADLKLVIFDVLSPTVKTPKQTIVAGLTNKLEEVVMGTLIARDDTELMLIVMDIDGNEVSKSVLLTVE